jgi:hypothetical protein
MTPTHTAVRSTEKTYLGIATSGGMRVWMAIPIEYTFRALFPTTLKLINTIRTLPKFPTGVSIAFISPPTSPLA